ncbi:hypothetical protein JXB28_00870 [Candidatus Woesearchaeota archaeon]|nr:hypothetical protein [Candidatus Woesearchaeota archaeon]
MNKKGDLSVNVIVVAAIALLVLVILAYLVASKLGWFAKATGCGGATESICVTSCDELDGTYRQIASGTDAGCSADMVCCVKVPG